MGTHKLKILNDPVYGFVSIPNALIFNLIAHPYFQRLRRITQMGLSNLVYPGANHTRFHHAIGCLHLMQKAIRVLKDKGVQISAEEANGLCIAILLHDIGHGAFSHALEHSIVSGISHEEISLKFMKKLNKEFKGQLNVAIQIFEGKHPREFLNQLVSSQLDIDRLDYLKRDSFYTGVAEGAISSDRLITMMNVKDETLVIEKKGIYSIEKFLIARRLMYWQVYLHKTSLVAENTLVKVLQRAKELVKGGVVVPSTKTLYYFLHHSISKENFDDTTLLQFAQLDDYDVMAAIKDWVSHKDKILSILSKMIVHRNLFKIEMQNKPFAKQRLEQIRLQLKNNLKITEKELHYFVFTGKVTNQAYNLKKPIPILTKKGNLKDIVKASDQLNLKTLAQPVVKHYLCYPKKI